VTASTDPGDRLDCPTPPMGAFGGGRTGGEVRDRRDKGEPPNSWGGEKRPAWEGALQYPRQRGGGSRDVRKEYRGGILLCSDLRGSSNQVLSSWGRGGYHVS